MAIRLEAARSEKPSSCSLHPARVRRCTSRRVRTGPWHSCEDWLACPAGKQHCWQVAAASKGAAAGCAPEGAKDQRIPGRRAHHTLQAMLGRSSTRCASGSTTSSFGAFFLQSGQRTERNSQAASAQDSAPQSCKASRASTCRMRTWKVGMRSTLFTSPHIAAARCLRLCGSSGLQPAGLT